MFSLTWRSAKTWRRTSIWGSLTEASFCKECFPTNQKFLRLPVQKLWPIMWILQKWWPWPWSLSDFYPKKMPGSFELSTWAVEFSKDRTSRVALHVQLRKTNRQTDRQTDRQTAVTNILCKNLRFCKVTNRGDQYTLQKSTILQSNKVNRRRIVIKFGTVLAVRVSTGSKKFQIFGIFFDDFRANNTL